MFQEPVTVSSKFASFCKLSRHYFPAIIVFYMAKDLSNMPKVFHFAKQIANSFLFKRDSDVITE